MTSDPRAAMARDRHRQANEADEVAARHRAVRDELILQLRREDPRQWSYGAIAGAIGCSRELVAKIVRQAGRDPSSPDCRQERRQEP